MKILVNGKEITVEDGINIEQLLDKMQLSHKRLAVEINQTIIPASSHSKHIIKAQDKVEIVQAIGGG